MSHTLSNTGAWAGLEQGLGYSVSYDLAAAAVCCCLLLLLLPWPLKPPPALLLQTLRDGGRRGGLLGMWSRGGAASACEGLKHSASPEKAFAVQKKELKPPNRLFSPAYIRLSGDLGTVEVLR